MTRRSFVIGAVLFTAGAGLGSLLTYISMVSSRSTYPLAMTAEERHAAQVNVDLVKASVLLRGVAQACMWKLSNDEDWTLPDSVFELIEELSADDVISREHYDEWPGGERRPPGEPPFYIVGTAEDIARRDPRAVLFYEHPAHHPEGGGSIVYADTLTETFGPAAFAEAIAAFKSE